MDDYYFKMFECRKTVSLIIAISFLTITITPCIANPVLEEDIGCYGFIASLVECENKTVENQLNCKIKHMVNDLLREQIPVYWTTTNLMVLTNELEQNFEKGTFIIPFTGNDKQDTKLTAIIYDYNQSSEIEENNIKIPVYELMESLNTPVYQLSEVKIAIFKSPRTSGENFYLDVAGKCGFLTFEYLEDKYLVEELNNTAFNVLIWPAGDSYYVNRVRELFIAGFIEWVSGIRFNRYGAIRDFIGNGGGFIGSCYGAYVASCGILPIPIYLKRRAYNPKLTTIGLLAVSDVLTVPIIKPLGVIEERIVDNTHPVTYGLQTILFDGHLGGPRFVHVGKNSQVVATFYNTSKTLDGTPSWISSEFGDGKIMIFSGHPEFIDSDVYPFFMEPAVKEYYTGKKIISNALHYTTSKEIKKLDTSQSRPLSFIYETWNKTSDLMNDIKKTVNIFGKVKINIDETLNQINNLTNEINLSIDIIHQIPYKKNIDVDKKTMTSLSSYSIYFIKHYVGLLEVYLKNTSKILNIIERLYSLIQNDTDFIEQIKTLKIDLLTKINETKIILSKCYDTVMEYTEALFNYQQNQKFSKIKENRINKIVHKLGKQIRMGFQYTPQAYFNSLKFIRSHWYNYESTF